VGWDGYLYPWTFSVHDFEPITGRIHQPPPSHQTFQGRNFVICSFCPRRLDFDPLAVPIPYHHSNLQSEEMIYYVSGKFGSRRGVDVGSITLHPSGLPHGPQPGLAEKSPRDRRRMARSDVSGRAYPAPERASLGMPAGLLQSVTQVVTDAKRVRHRGQSGVDRADAREDARVDDIQVVELVCAALGVHH
jgi:hypothetical protein